MRDLLTEGQFSFTTMNGCACICIKNTYNDGIANIGGNIQNIILTEYGLHALENNLINILNALDDYKLSKKNIGRL